MPRFHALGMSKEAEIHQKPVVRTTPMAETLPGDGLGVRRISISRARQKLPWVLPLK